MNKLINSGFGTLLCIKIANLYKNRQGGVDF